MTLNEAHLAKAKDKAKIRIPNLALHQSMEKSHNQIHFENQTLLSPEGFTNTNTSFLRNTSKRHNFLSSKVYPKIEFNNTNIDKFGNLKISANNKKFYTFRSSGYSNDYYNKGFITNTNIKSQKKKKAVNIEKNGDKSSTIIQETSRLNTYNSKQNQADQHCVNINLNLKLNDNPLLSKAGSLASTATNKNLKKINFINNNNDTQLNIANINTVNKNVNSNNNQNLNSEDFINNKNNNNNKSNKNILRILNNNISPESHLQEFFKDNIKSFAKNVNANTSGANPNKNYNNNFSLNISNNPNIFNLNQSLKPYEAKASYKSLKNASNLNIMNNSINQNINLASLASVSNSYNSYNNRRDSNMTTKEEKDLLNKFGAGGNSKDANCEKNKLLETIYEKLNEKNTNNIKEQAQTYCQKFLNYSNKEMEELFSK